jgi:hypothetical protein
MAMSMATADSSNSEPRAACATCGTNLCVNPSFCRICRRADAHRTKEGRPESAHVVRLPRLLDDNMSLERVWTEVNQRRGNDVPQSTVEALIYELRRHGLIALQHSNCLRRLDDVSTAHLREMLSRLIKLRPKYLAITDDLLLKLGGLL